MNEIIKDWEVFKETPFPSSAVDVEIDGYDLVSLDTYMAGCIDTFIVNKGSLDIECQKILEKCLAEVHSVIPRLDGHAKEYFIQLSLLGIGVVSWLSKNR